MGFSQESGYTPATIDTLMLSVMENLNIQFETSYTQESFIGTNWYKFFYALIQRLQENEVKTSEIFVKLQQYFEITNENIQRPVVTNPGLIEVLETSGYISSVKPMIVGDAGKIHVAIDVDDGVHAEGNVTITSYTALVSGTDDTVTVAGQAFVAQSGAAVEGAGTFQAATSNEATAASLALQINSHAAINTDVRARAVGAVVEITAFQGGVGGNAITLTYTEADGNAGATVSGAVLSGGEDNEDYEDTRLAICTIIKDSTVAGAITQGTESETIVLSNGQSFDFKFNLPNRLITHLKLTTTLSENNMFVILAPEDIKALLLANIEEKYRLGLNFEPQKYFTVVDAPWASQVLLEWSHDDGATWSDDVYNADYDELFDISLENITLVEA